MSQKSEKNTCFEKWQTGIKNMLFKGPFLFQDIFTMTSDSAVHTNLS